ncbi:fibronectin type III domain-containing protein [bacterium]|nr:fibronectin type III domain-containing protein [bacterium]
MKNLVVLFSAAVLSSLLLVACATQNGGVNVVPERDASAAFSVEAVEGQGTFVPEYTVENTAKGVAVQINARQAADLAAAYVHLYYDPAGYTPVDVEFGDFLGGASETVTIDLVDIDGLVPLGIAQITSSGVKPATGAGELATVYFKAEPSATSRAVSAAPRGEYNKVTDLSILDQTTEEVTLRWTEVHIGDYNNDGLVTVNDLTPIGQNFGVSVASASDPLKVGLVDGNKDGQITVNDITQIGQNFGSALNGYWLYLDTTGTNAYESGISAFRTDFDDDMNHPLIYTYTADISGQDVSAYTVRPAETGVTPMPETLSDPAIGSVPGPPDPPTDVTVESDEDSGHQTVLVEWTRSTSVDVASYFIERKMTSEDDSAWAERGQVGSAADSYSDFDASFSEADSYDYRVKAVDTTELSSDWVEAGPVTPYIEVGPPPPTNIIADNTVHSPRSIDVQWTPPADESKVSFYRVYRQGPGDAQFNSVFDSPNKYTENYLDTELTAGETYTYYVVSVNNHMAEGDPSATAGATPSTYEPQVTITGLTTDKTTHYFVMGGDGVSSNITVTTDDPPTSYEWNSTQGAVSGTGATVTWIPGADSTGVGTVEISVTVHNYDASDSASLTLYLVDKPIQTTMGNGGHYINFTGDCQNAIVEGGTETTRSLSDFATQDHVILLDRWESS